MTTNGQDRTQNQRADDNESGGGCESSISSFQSIMARDIRAASEKIDAILRLSEGSAERQDLLQQLSNNPALHLLVEKVGPLGEAVKRYGLRHQKEDN